MKSLLGEDVLGPINLEMYAPIMDVDLDIYAELDKRTVTFRELVSLDIDSLLPLGRPTGENIDIYVGGVLLGSGEILIIEGCLAVRIADLCDKLSPLEHFQSSTVDEQAA
ncbi:MAG: FliM/FliN family flagellar motor switch protein [Acidobacteriaceae bacterium]|nr:FliM/FliN family flagellar motor switch protein [Acidobacteriaceae bacterium]